MNATAGLFPTFEPSFSPRLLKGFNVRVTCYDVKESTRHE